MGERRSENKNGDSRRWLRHITRVILLMNVDLKDKKKRKKKRKETNKKLRRKRRNVYRPTMYVCVCMCGVCIYIYLFIRLFMCVYHLSTPVFFFIKLSNSRIRRNVTTPLKYPNKRVMALRLALNN